MRLWNFRDLSELGSSGGDDVLSRRADARKQRRSGTESPWKAKFTVLVGMSVVAASFTIGTINGSASVKIPVSPSAVIQNIPESMPPLGSYFSPQLGEDGWSKSSEDELLRAVEAKRLDRSPLSRLDEAIDAAASNQKEDLADSERFTRDEVRMIIKGRRITK
jgi:hypothetical protein